MRVIGFREVDRTLNLSLKPRSFEMLENDAQMILTYLESNGGFMTLNDKSSPDDIKATFGISKGQFKESTWRLDEGWQNCKIRPVWDRVDLGALWENHFTLGSWPSAILKVTVPKLS